MVVRQVSAIFEWYVMHICLEKDSRNILLPRYRETRLTASVDGGCLSFGHGRLYGASREIGVWLELNPLQQFSAGSRLLIGSSPHSQIMILLTHSP